MEVRLTRISVVFGCLALTACVEQQGPSAAMADLMYACRNGNVEACATVAQIEQQERMRVASIPPPVWQNSRLDASDFRFGGNRCTYTGYGNTVYQTCN